MSARSEQNTTEAIKSIIATIYSAQNSLRALAPEYKWKGLGNVLGDYGEYVTIRHYGLTKGEAVADGFDARTPDGRTVQVKTNHAADQIGFRGEANFLLVIKVHATGDWEELYYGDFDLVKRASRRSERDNKWMIAVRKLRALAGQANRPAGAPDPPRTSPQTSSSHT